MITSALTVLQPFASAIAAGHKRIENRPWRRKIPEGGMWIGLHAGAKFYNEADEIRRSWIAREMWNEPPLLEKMPLGVLMGVLHIADVEKFPSDALRTNPWAFGPWCWRIDRYIALPEPIKCRGMQGLWPLKPEHRDALAALIER